VRDRRAANVNRRNVISTSSSPLGPVCARSGDRTPWTRRR